MSDGSLKSVVGRAIAAARRGLKVFLALTVAACAQPYETPKIEANPGAPASFDGVEALVSTTAPGRVLWVHGICPTDWRWAMDRAQLLATALGNADITYAPPVSWPKPDKEGTVQAKLTLREGRGSLDTTFFIWSNLTDKYRWQTQFDHDGTVGDTRASLNASIKAGLIDQCFMDAIVYSGKNGDRIRAAMLETTCQTLGGTLDALNRCDFSSASEPRKVAFVTESIGSKILFDAVRELWRVAPTGSETAAKERPGVARSALARRLAHVQMIYMAANQIPLLDQANPIPVDAKAVAPSTDEAQISTMTAVTNLLSDSRTQPTTAVVGLPPVTIVAFSDPNDLLSYKLPSWLPAPPTPTLSTSPFRMIGHILDGQNCRHPRIVRTVKIGR
jgi:hypothetical protein